MDRGLTGGFFLAFIVTMVAAVPAVFLAASNGFRGLEMMWMFTVFIAIVGVVAGLIAFAVGFSLGWSSNDEPTRNPPPQEGPSLE